jgi:hypothetical protein
VAAWVQPRLWLFINLLLIGPVNLWMLPQVV